VLTLVNNVLDHFFRIVYHIFREMFQLPTSSRSGLRSHEQPGPNPETESNQQTCRANHKRVLAGIHIFAPFFGLDFLATTISRSPCRQPGRDGAPNDIRASTESIYASHMLTVSRSAGAKCYGFQYLPDVAHNHDRV